MAEVRVAPGDDVWFNVRDSLMWRHPGPRAGVTPAVESIAAPAATTQPAATEARANIDDVLDRTAARIAELESRLEAEQAALDAALASLETPH